MLELQNICKSYGGQQVLTDINLTVREREMVSIMGKSGTGKSTLLSIMAGLVRADSGHVIFQDSVISDLDEEKLAALRDQGIISGEEFEAKKGQLLGL